MEITVSRAAKPDLRYGHTLYILSLMPSDFHLFGHLKANSHVACCAHAVPLPCCAAKGLEYVFPI